jgi:23S rRNA (cytosine1962-C5)-methyltransferase
MARSERASEPKRGTGAVVVLRKPLRATLAAGHPWVFRDALEPFTIAPGELVTVVDARGRFVARGWSEAGPIAVRVLTALDEPVDTALLTTRVAEAAALRDRVCPPDTDAYRLLHGEGDRIPGLVCDVYGACATVQLDGEAAPARREQLLGVLRPVLEARAVATVMLRWGRRGARHIEHVWGPEPPEPVSVVEHGMRLLASLRRGQKTGLFLDHREGRARVRALAGAARVLDLYAYVGGFSAAAGLGGAERVDSVDVAPEAIALGEQVWRANGLPRGGRVGHASDVPEFLAAARERGDSWDLIIADPPSFAPNEASKPQALRSYAMLHAACLQVLAPGGLLLAASCSSHVRAHELDAALAEGAAKSRRIVQVIERWGAPADHPRLLAFPEGDYLDAVLARALS